MIKAALTNSLSNKKAAERILNCFETLIVALTVSPLLKSEGNQNLAFGGPIFLFQWGKY